MAKKEKTKQELAPKGYLSPFGMMSEFDRMFDEFRGGFEDMFQRPFSLERPLGTTRMAPLDMAREPLIDIADLGDRFELMAEMPGIPKDKIDIKVSDDGIEINAEAEEMSLPDEVVSDKVEAKMRDGMLKITLPKKKAKEKPKVRKLEVK